MAKNRNKKKRSGVAPMDTAEPTLTDVPQSMDTSESVATNTTHFPASGVPIKRLELLKIESVPSPPIPETQKWELYQLRTVVPMQTWNDCCRAIILSMGIERLTYVGGRPRVSKSFDNHLLDGYCGSAVSAESHPEIYVNLFHNRKKGVAMKRSKNVRKMKAIAKAISQNEKSTEKISKNESKTMRAQSAKVLYD
ncbi:hypothetical protein CK203_031490 [Vitis vinifera]|uniref:Uncharacterized protein n=1 Tax=Vitis vinifera TaxID=29760 RepID=A0A438I8N2_VITVI|nr:hypothetical protein CK203_031490 [Vitis vinifera]